MALDVTACTTVIDSYVATSSQSVGSVAEQAADRKCQKYAERYAVYDFQPLAVKTPGPMDESTICFLSDLGRKITERSGDQIESRFFIPADQCAPSTF